MKNTLDLAPHYLQTILQILQQHLPNQSNVWVFGSRVTGTAKKFSDIDLLIDAAEPLSLGLMARLAYDFEESDLPYKVDLVDWTAIDESFRNRIVADRVLIYPEQSA